MDMRKALGASSRLANRLVDATAIVTHTFGFGDAREVMTGIVDGTLPAIKAVMLPNG
jgi:hypothetical protein